MYLTEAWLDAEVALRRKLHDSYDWHRAVWEFFPGHESDRRAFLTRIEAVRGRVRLYVVSDWKPRRPEWWPEGEAHWRCKQIPEEFFLHRRYVFQVCANPTRKKVKLDEQSKRLKNGRRDPLKTREELEEWIARKGSEGGFSVQRETLRIIPLGRRYFVRKGEVGMHTAVDYRGVLEVSDSKRFRETFRKGIGPAKGFGFGLLLLAPVG